MDERDPFRYKVYDYAEAPILAKDIPMPQSVVGRQMMGLFKVVVNYLAKVGVINAV